jgi:polyisoprenyl-phosphate glycosyltransferase
VSAAVPLPLVDDTPEVTVVLPCYNERDHVELEVKRIRAALEEAGMRYEVLCVDDGSTDGTREVLEAIPGIRTILLPATRGRGRPGGSAPSRPAARWWSGPMPT